jgi:hypothetical protein
MTQKYASAASTKTVYHESKGCDRIDDPERVTSRPDSYIEWHDLEPCAYCAKDDVYPNINDDSSQDLNNALRKEGKNNA